LIETIKFVLIKKIGNNVLMERAGYMKKTLTMAYVLFLVSLPSFASNYEYVQNGNVGYQSQYTAKTETKDIFQNPTEDAAQGFENNNETADAQNIVSDKTLKKKYNEITKSAKLIEAVELLKNNAGSFSYKSIHGSNPTGSPIKISFKNMSNDQEHQNADAYGQYEGKKYAVYVNAKYEKSPAGAIAPLLARESLVNPDKTESDKEIAKQLQVAVWTQLCAEIAGLESKNDALVRTQNMLKSGANTDDYSVFLKNNNEKTQPKKSKEDKSKKKPKGHALQTDFDAEYQAESAKTDVLTFDSKEYQKKYKKITNEDRVIEALELLKNTVGKFSYEAILQKNLTHKPMVIKFKNLSDINPQYATFDALGWKQGGKLHIYINSKHADAPAAAIAALLSHEALHQDEFDSLNEETYAWTMEASVWTQLCDQQPNVEKINHPLVTRENMLKQLFQKGNYSSKYIKKSVFSNPSYSKLPIRSPGFEEDL